MIPENRRGTTMSSETLESTHMARTKALDSDDSPCIPAVHISITSAITRQLEAVGATS